MKLLSRIASHAGSWYSEDPVELSQQLSNSLLAAQHPKLSGFLKSIIVPHAGYRFCMATSAYAFAQVDATKYKRAIVIGPSHHAYFEGCGLTKFKQLDTPLGPLGVDLSTNAELLKNNLFFTLDQDVDISEHSIEMELPFIKQMFAAKDVGIVPIMIGQLSTSDIKKVSDALLPYFMDTETLFVISSDFCHWGKRFNYIYYNKEDGEIWKSIEKLDLHAVEIISSHSFDKFVDYLSLTKNTICGRNAILALISCIEKDKDAQYHTELLKYTQSSQITNDMDSSVSYVAAASYKQ